GCLVECACEADGTYRVCVVDQGPGIADLAPVLGGTGGLARVRRLVHRFEVQSAPGLGTRVMLEQRAAGPTGREEGDSDELTTHHRELLAVLEELQRASEAGWHFLDSAADAVVVVDRGGRIARSNPEVERLLGWDAGQLVGQPLETLVPERFRKDHSTYRDEFAVNPRLRRMGGAGLLYARHRDGRDVPVEISLHPLQDGVAAVVRDRTQQVASEQFLRNLAEERGAFAFDRLVLSLAGVLGADAVVVSELSPDGLRVAVVAACSAGEPLEPFDYPLAGTPCQQAAAERRPVFIPERARELFPEADCLRRFEAEGVAVCPLAAETGVLAAFFRRRVEHPDRVLGVMQIFAARAALELRRQRAEEQRRSLEEQFRQAQKMEAIGLLAGGVAHDFNNLLTVIQSCASLLLEMPLEADAAELLRDVQLASQRASDLTRQLLAFGRKQILQPRVLDLNAKLRQDRGLLSRLIGEDIQVLTDLDEDLGRVRVDPSQLQQVVINLAVNARDAMPQGGTLRLSTRNLGTDQVVLEVCDTGCGMDAETCRRIFDPFFTTKEVGRGTGLGLSTVLGIVEQSGGTIQVSSQPGQGTTFTIALPRSEIAEVTSSGSKRNPIPQGTGTILLVEDDPAVRKLVARVLTACGYRVLAAEQGEQALELAGRHEGAIDLLITDIVMPGMNGRQLSERLSRERPDLKTLFISGHTDDAIFLRGVACESVSFLRKPIHPGILATTVRELLSSTPSTS
ncbi:MAG: ATP-binding protein, partial [Candidatus Eremiobacterota bacterium]